MILEADGRRPSPRHLIARLAAGGMRDAESMLDQLLSAGDGPIDEARVRGLLGLADAEAVGGFVDAWSGDVRQVRISMTSRSAVGTAGRSSTRRRGHRAELVVSLSDRRRPPGTTRPPSPP
jgi:hypothetical protein